VFQTKYSAVEEKGLRRARPYMSHTEPCRHHKRLRRQLRYRNDRRRFTVRSVTARDLRHVFTAEHTSIYFRASAPSHLGPIGRAGDNEVTARAGGTRPSISRQRLRTHGRQQRDTPRSSSRYSTAMTSHQRSGHFC